MLWLHIALGVTISRDPLLQKAYWQVPQKKVYKQEESEPVQIFS